MRLESASNGKGELVLLVKGIPFGHGFITRKTTYQVVDGHIGHRESVEWAFRDSGKMDVLWNPPWLDAWLVDYLEKKIQAWFNKEVSQ